MVAELEQIELVSTTRGIPMRRVWAMPSKNTFDIPPIRALVKSYLYQSKVSIDPFARNKRWATYTNDLNPDTAADSHLPAKEFLATLNERGVCADFVLFDPPYSPRQIVECYQSIGVDINFLKAGIGWKAELDLLAKLLTPGGIAICCGWNSSGLGSSRGFAMEEVLLVQHGGAHNDTICTVERKIESMQSGLFESR